MKKQSTLQFTPEERTDPTLQNPIAKSEKMADKAEKAHSKIPKKIVKRKERTFDAETGKSKVRLYFEEVDKPKPPSKLSHAMGQSPRRAVTASIHRKVSESEKENVGIETAHSIEKAGEFTVHRAEGAYHSRKLKPYRTMAKADKKSVKADVNYLYKKSLRENPKAASNPVSKWQQKHAIKKQYMTARSKGGTATAKTGNTVTSTVKKGGDMAIKSVSAVVKSPKVLLAVFALLLIAAVLSAVVSSCSVLFQGIVTNVVSTSYTSESAQLVATNDNYTALELALQTRIDSTPSDYPDFDEYRYDLDTIAHDPHELTAYITAKYIYYTAEDVAREVEALFELQYNLTITEVVEVRYRMETSIDSEGTATTEEVPYNYYILNVKLTSRSVDGVARALLNAEQLELYEVCRLTKGNNSLLFGGGSIDETPSTDLSGVEFVEGIRLDNQNIVDIALSQEGNVGGQPYWSWYGFDDRVEWCATYVSWVLHQAGYTEPRFAACQSQGVPYFSVQGRWANGGYSDIAPGDVIFFDWEGDGRSDHVGIVVGTDGSRVYTVEGNSGDACKIKDYALNSDVIMGYGLMN